MGATLRDDGRMPQTEPPAWIAAATSAAVRLAAEAGAEADDILEHAGDASPDRLASQISRLEESAAVTEVATDLAGLLWAECEDVPPIATILEEPATQAALEAVAEARRQAAGRLTAVAVAANGAHEQIGRPASELAPSPSSSPFEPTSVAEPPPSSTPEPAAATGLRRVASPAAVPPAATVVPPTAAVPTSAVAGSSSETGRRTGAVLAGAAAAAIVLFGRRLRRA